MPLPTAADDHQRKNAEVLARPGAAEVIEQTELTGERAGASGSSALRRRRRRARSAMAAAARALARPDAAQRRSSIAALAAGWRTERT